MQTDTPQPDEPQDRRARYRSRELTNPMAVITLTGGPLYQLKIRDLSEEGVGIVARSDSAIFEKIAIGQDLLAGILLPRGYKGPTGCYRARVEHITEIKEGPFAGHMLIGLSFLTEASEQEFDSNAAAGADPFFHLE
jgi:hypothetical protein